MSPGRASCALTIFSPFWPASALRTQVCTAAQPPPGILCPAFSIDQVMNDAHHGLPGPTFAAARYSSTSLPRLAPPISCTPFWEWAIARAAEPSELPPPPAGAPSPAAGRRARRRGVDGARDRCGRRRRLDRGPVLDQLLRLGQLELVAP